MCQSSFTFQIATPSFSREQKKNEFAAKEELRKEQDGLHHSCMNHVTIKSQEAKVDFLIPKLR
jgi:hypothetical protein